MSVRNADWFMTISRGQAIKGMRHLQDPSKRGRSLGSAQTAHVHFAGMLPLKRGAFSLIHWSTFPDFQHVAFACRCRFCVQFRSCGLPGADLSDARLTKSLRTYATSSLYSPAMKWYVLNRLGGVPADQATDCEPKPSRNLGFPRQRSSCERKDLELREARASLAPQNGAQA